MESQPTEEIIQAPYRASWLWLVVINAISWIPFNGALIYHCVLYNPNTCSGGENFTLPLAFIGAVFFGIGSLVFAYLNIIYKGSAARKTAIVFSIIGFSLNVFIVGGNFIVNLPYHAIDGLFEGFLNDYANRFGFLGIFVGSAMLGLGLWSNERSGHEAGASMKKSGSRLLIASFVVLFIGMFFVPYPGYLNYKSSFFTPAFELLHYKPPLSDPNWR